MQPEGLKKTNFLDYSILIPYLILSIFGLVMVFSVSVPEQLQEGGFVYKQVITQAVFFVLSLIFMFIIYRLKIRTFKSRVLVGFFIPIELVLLIVARIAPAVNGAHGWIQIPGRLGTIQPAEFLKIFVIWYLASVLSKRQKKIAQRDIYELFERKHWYGNILTGWRLPIILMLAIVVLMPDLGNAIIIMMIVLSLIAVSGISYKWAGGYFRIALVVIATFFVILFARNGNLIPGSYLNNRFKAFVNPFPGIISYGRQMANSYYAISNGGWLGRGLGNSIEKKGYLSEASTDFIFPIVIEELGVIGGIIILGILFFMILRILLVGIRARDPFNAMIAIGAGVMFLVQTFVNVGGAIGLIPETGVTFPFLSQGGSSLFVLSIAVALVLNVAAHEKLLELNELSTLPEGHYEKK